MNAPQGRCYWAVAPFSPTPPFQIYAGTEHEPVRASTTAIVNAAGRGDPQFSVIVPVKARPVLVLTSTLKPFDDVLALRLRALDKLTVGDQERVRAHDDDGLFYLQPDVFAGLPKENAAIVSALLRLPVSAIDTSRELGQMDANELRVVHERVARAHDLKLDMLALEQARRLVQRLRAADR